MKQIALTIALILILAACTLPAPNTAPSSQGTPTATLEEQSVLDLVTATSPAQGADQPAAQAKASPTSPPAVTNTAPAPTNTPAPLAEATKAPTTQAPTKTSTAVPRLDAASKFGEPKYENPMVYNNLTEWAKPETGALPDDAYIRLQFKDGKLYVTGKQTDFFTWWFSYHFLEDAYVQMTFDSETCSGTDTYGMIIRGPEHLAGVSYGYVAMFTCDGQYSIFRLDGIDPWQVKTLVDETRTDYLRTGSDKENVIGFQADGDKLTLVVNGYQIAQVQDDKYTKGRIGVFVRSAGVNDYTYRLTNLKYWVLNEDK
jgi:hypothetical protein